MNTTPLHPRAIDGAAGFVTQARRPLVPAVASAVILLVALLIWAPTTGHALPSFARQINMQCTACHTEFPVLNQFGRQFKLSGYTASADDTTAIPLAVMLQPSFTRTATAQAGGAAPGFSDNNNFALTQASIFYAGRVFGPFFKSEDSLLNKFGVFLQTTYDGVGKSWALDQTEFRFANTATLGGKDANYGFYLNNNPTMQDPWNSTPAWGYPFTGSGLAPGPAAGTLIDGGFAGQVGGLGAYLFFNDTYYIDLGAYRTLGVHFQKQLGIDPTGETQIAGLAPYWRLAMERMVGEGRWEVGTFGLAADTYPGRDSSAGHDRMVDFGLDTQYQISKGPHDVTASASWISERQNWDASSLLGKTGNAADTLHAFKATVNYLYDKTYGVTGQYFSITGGEDPVLYSGSATGSPNSDGFILQANYLPFNKGGGPSFWPRSNVKLTLQYVFYNRFDGARTNFDGAGANARDNNTLYLEAWIVF